MSLQYVGLNEINGSLVVLDHVKDASYDEMVELQLKDGSTRLGRIVQIEGERVVVQVFEGTNSLSLANTKTRLLGHPMELPVSKEILGRVFSGAGKPIDGLGEIYAEKSMDINGQPLNPVARVYPRNYINTGISSIDCLTTLIRGQKLPIFSGSGLPHNQLAVQIVKQAKVKDDDGSGFAVVFAAMGVTNDVAEYFRRSFEEAGVMQRVVMFLNLSNDPIIERTLTPRCALTAAEKKAKEQEKYAFVCPGSMAKAIKHNTETSTPVSTSQLSQWPVQIKLVPVNAPYFDNANLLIAADCSAYAYGNFHNKFIKNRITLIGCPKLDDIDYTEKLQAIIESNNIKSVTIVRMEVPCCGGIEYAAKTALQNSGKFIPWQVYTIGTNGEILD